MTTIRETVESTTDHPLEHRIDAVVALLHDRSKGIRELDRYLQDAATDAHLAALLREIRSQDVAFVEHLKDYLRGRLTGYDPAHIGEPW